MDDEFLIKNNYFVYSLNKIKEYLFISYPVLWEESTRDIHVVFFLLYPVYFLNLIQI